MARLIVDVRESEEYVRSHIDGAINIPPVELLGELKQLVDTPKDTEIILYCRTGSRSNVAMRILQARGFTNLANGINEAHVAVRLRSVD